jgi:large-conductance mechanosensitive channel
VNRGTKYWMRLTVSVLFVTVVMGGAFTAIAVAILLSLLLKLEQRR